eukprot:scaffold27525_cov96-Isochrysis_galbana.AAC.1
MPSATGVVPPPEASTLGSAARLGDGFCAWYDVRRAAFQPLAEVQARRWPRLGELVGPSATNGTLCDGYGAGQFGEKRMQLKCAQCPGDPYRRELWSVLQCSAAPLVPQPSASWPLAARSPYGAAPIEVLLVVSDHNNHGLFAQVERVLNQLHLAEHRGLVPHVFLGQMVFNAPDACDVGHNQYFEPSRGDNVWDYYFEPVSPYRTGDARLANRPVRLLSASVDDARRHAIAISGDAVSSYFEFKQYDERLHATRTRVRRMGGELVARWLRVKLEIRREAADLLRQVYRRGPRHFVVAAALVLARMAEGLFGREWLEVFVGEAGMVRKNGKRRFLARIQVGEGCMRRQCQTLWTQPVWRTHAPSRPRPALRVTREALPCTTF